MKTEELIRYYKANIEAIEKGLKEDAYQTTVALVKTKEPLEIKIGRASCRERV